MNKILDNHREKRRLSTLVENRTIYSSEHAELSIFETHANAEKVSLTFDFPVIASMLTGKKVMHLEGMPSFEFFPGESVIMPSHKEMVIDFPLATEANPTQCLALGIDPDKIEAAVQKFNGYVAIDGESHQWELDNSSSHLINNADINHLVNRLTYTFTANDSTSKDVLLDLMIQELVVRLLQTKAKSLILSLKDNMFTDTRIGSVIKYIKDNLTNKDITVDTLAAKACMSTSHFHKKFKNTLGISPIDYINSEKIKFAKNLIKSCKNVRMSEIAHMAGFNNTSYFNRQFKKMEMMTPQQFKASIG